MRLAAIASHGAQLRQLAEQRRQIVRTLLANGRVEAAGALGRFQHIPKRNALSQQERAFAPIRKARQILPKRRGQQRPELVLRMAVVLAPTQRFVARQGSENQHSGAPIENGRKSMLDLHPRNATTRARRKNNSGTATSHSSHFMPSRYSGSLYSRHPAIRWNLKSSGFVK